MGARRNAKAPPIAPRRGSQGTPNSTPILSSRSRSLDGLLDAENKTNDTITNKTNEQALSCERLETDSSPEEINHRSKSLDDLEDPGDKTVKNSEDDNMSDKIASSNSTLSNDSRKRKRNFMDRCVNKVRSFIKKNDTK